MTVFKIAIHVAAATFCLAFFSACNNAARQQEGAINRLRGLQDAFNKGACQSFYDVTETHGNESRQDWIGGCQRMRESLGTWQSLSSVTAQSLKDTQPQALFVEGIASFVHDGHIETYRLETYWKFIGSESRLYFFYLEGGGKEFALPKLPKPIPKLDPEKGQRGAALVMPRSVLRLKVARLAAVETVVSSVLTESDVVRAVA